jgi:hypothetical protein
VGQDVPPPLVLPRTGNSDVVRDDVDEDTHPEPARLGRQGGQAGAAAAGRVDGGVARDVVPVVRPALGGEHRGQVHPVDAEILQVAQRLGGFEQVEVLGDLEPVRAGRRSQACLLVVAYLLTLPVSSYDPKSRITRSLRRGRDRGVTWISPYPVQPLRSRLRPLTQFVDRNTSVPQDDATGAGRGTRPVVGQAGDDHPAVADAGEQLGLGDLGLDDRVEASVHGLDARLGEVAEKLEDEGSAAPVLATHPLRVAPQLAAGEVVGHRPLGHLGDRLAEIGTGAPQVLDEPLGRDEEADAEAWDRGSWRTSRA